jgi:hypothetical protein
MAGSVMNSIAPAKRATRRWLWPALLDVARHEFSRIRL